MSTQTSPDPATEDPGTGPAERYVYGVVSTAAQARLPAKGLAETAAPPRLVEDGDLAAVVSDVPCEGIEGDRDTLLAHSRVLEEVLAETAVLPMRFGVVMPDDDAIRSELLAAHRERLTDLLESMRGRVELAVKAYYDEEIVLREVVNERPEIAELNRVVREAPQAATYYQRIRLGEMVAAALEAKRQEDAGRVLAALEPLAVRVAPSDLSHERMAVNVALLVERERVPDVDGVVQGLHKELGSRMRFRYFGPVPPYSFVDLDVETGRWA